MKRRVVITGMGIISPLGIGAEANWEALTKGQCGIAEITSFDASMFPLKIAGEVKEFSPQDHIANRKSIKLMSRCSQMAVAAAGMAVTDAGVDLDDVDPFQVGIYMGLGMASGDLDEILPMLRSSLDDEGNFSLNEFGSRGLSSLNPVLSFKVLSNFPLCHTAIAFNIQGLNLTFNSFAPGAAQAVGEAFRAVQHGQAEIAFAGGTDSQISAPGFIALSQMGLLAKGDGKGLIPGEGASFVILEEMEQAVRRKAHIHAELIGYGQATRPTTGYGYTADTTGCALAMRKALLDGGIKPADVGYINTSADSHPVGDLAEAEAIDEVFSEHTQNMVIGSTKPMAGNLLAAAEPFETSVCAGVLEKGVVPCPCQERTVEVAMSNSFGFCGSCVSLALRKFRE